MDGCEDKQSSLIADFAVDVAIVAIQLVVPFFYSQDAVRITGRTKPAWTGSVVKSNGQISSKTHRQDPGFALSGGAFEEMLSNGKNTIDSLESEWPLSLKTMAYFPI